MKGIIDLNKTKIPVGKVLIKIVNNIPSGIILPDEVEPSSIFSHYEVILINAVTTIELEVGDYIVAANGIPTRGGFERDGEVYIIIPGYSIDAVVKPDNFKQK